jgi:hypothetical protein
MDPHEEAFIAAFLTKAYRERCLAKKGLPRQDLRHALPSKLNDRRTFELPNNVHLPDRILEALRRLYPVETGFCISAISGIDGTRITMSEFEDHEGTVVSFIPGKLAYYQSEYGQPTFQCLLVRDSAMEKKVAAVLKDVSAHYRREDTRP